MFARIVKALQRGAKVVTQLRLILGALRSSPLALQDLPQNFVSISAVMIAIAIIVE